MLNKSVKQNEQWSDYIYQLFSRYNNKFVHSSTGFTPNNARNKANELMTYINKKFQANANRTYPEINVADNAKKTERRICL